MEKSHFTEEALKGSALNLFSVSIGKFGGLVFTILLARFLLPENFGIYGLAISVALMFFTFADLGINTALIKYVSASVGKKDREEAASYFQYLLKVKLIFVFSIAFMLLILAYPISNFVYNKSELFLPLIFSSIYLILLSLTGFLEALFYAFKRVELLFLKETMFHMLRIATVVLIFSLLTWNLYLRGVFLALIFTGFLVLIMVIIFLKKFFPFILKKSQKKINKSDTLKFLGFLSIGGISGAFFSYIDIIILGIFVSSAYVGYYKAATSLVFSVLGFFVFFNIFLPIFTQIKTENIEPALNKAIRYSMMFAIPGAIGLSLIGKYFIRVIYGYSYLDASVPLTFLSFLIIETIFSGILVTFFTAKEKLKPIMILVGMSVPANMLLDYFLIKFLTNLSETYAMAGAAIATLTVKYFLLISFVVILHKNFKIKIYVKNILRPLVASVVMAGFLVYFNNYFSDMNLFLGLSEIMLGILIYFIIMLIIRGITLEDFLLFKKINLLRIFRKN